MEVFVFLLAAFALAAAVIRAALWRALPPSLSSTSSPVAHVVLLLGKWPGLARRHRPPPTVLRWSGSLPGPGPREHTAAARAR